MLELKTGMNCEEDGSKLFEEDQCCVTNIMGYA